MQDARAYHHGNLRAALIAASEVLLVEKGLEGFTLREAARRAGVSAAAPAHHFGDARGLLTAIAVLGFDALTRYLEEGADRGGADLKARLRGQGWAYVRFALEQPARFDLMFRRARLDGSDPELQRASKAAFAALQGAVDAAYLGDSEPSQADRVRTLGAWSTVHGFARLALDGELDRFTGDDGLWSFAELVLPKILSGFGD